MVFRSFLETLVQSLFDLTSDIKEYIRLGRTLWPIYIEPILPENITTTIMNKKGSNAIKGLKPTPDNLVAMQSEILSILDQKIFPYLRHSLEHGLGILCFDSADISNSLNSNSICRKNVDDIPLLVKYLLIAAFICQVNRQEKDRQLFTIEKNGKKRRKTKEDDTEEELAFGAGSQDHPKTMRPRTFPLERLYSIYVSIVSLNASNSLLHSSVSDNATDENEMIRTLGNVPFLETLTYLRDIGVLHDFPKRSKSEPIRFSQRFFWTSIARDEVQSIAISINFPLDSYIL
jgi:hypothetical protein